MKSNYNVVFVTWRDPDNRSWTPVARLRSRGGMYEFVYTRGALASKHFLPFGGLPQLDTVYVSSTLFPLFANRILARSRPEYHEYLKWLGLEEGVAGELDVLARSGGQRFTDTLEIVPCPSRTRENEFILFFFAHGLRHFDQLTRMRVSSLNQGAALYLARDVQNPVDRAALLMRTDDPISLVGYVPRYYSSDLTKLLELTPLDGIDLTVERLNLDAPSNLRMLCKIRSPWPADFEPCSDESFEPIPKLEPWQMTAS